MEDGMTYDRLPQLDRLCLTDAGLETDMIFNRGLDLPCFASIILLRSGEGRQALDSYFRSYLDLAVQWGTGFVLESASWRASRDWAEPLGLSLGELDQLNARSVDMLKQLRDEYAGHGLPIVVSACIGPRGDGYEPGRIMDVAEAEAYHSHQAEVLAAAGPDMLSAFTINSVNEAVGVTRAAARTGRPFALSFTVETDGCLPTGDTLEQAIATVDQASGGYPAYYMINCAHPTHFAATLAPGSSWTTRIGGIRANASRCSHAELDAMTELDDGDPHDLATLYRELRQRFPQLKVLRGCCGTDHRHVAEIARACVLEDGRAASGKLPRRHPSHEQQA
jgi:S-methylmethionine-dependent homocysteine/selenocysteine methylase